MLIFLHHLNLEELLYQNIKIIQTKCLFFFNASLHIFQWAEFVLTDNRNNTLGYQIKKVMSKFRENHKLNL